MVKIIHSASKGRDTVGKAMSEKSLAVTLERLKEIDLEMKCGNLVYRKNHIK
jgi:hypothetical protein